eukprot:Ihof_evm40s1 gene=Ihof_evmTU40s1
MENTPMDIQQPEDVDEGQTELCESFADYKEPFLIYFPLSKPRLRKEAKRTNQQLRAKVRQQQNKEDKDNLQVSETSEDTCDDPSSNADSAYGTDLDANATGEDGPPAPKIKRHHGRKERRLRTKLVFDREDVVRVCLDLSFEGTMYPGEVNSLARQVRAIYGSNVRNPNPVRLYISGLGGATEEQLALQTGFYDWAAKIEKRQYHEIFDPKDVIYLTPDSPNELTTIDHSKVYIIG